MINKIGSYLFAISKLPFTSTVSLIVFTPPSTFHLPPFRFDSRGVLRKIALSYWQPPYNLEWMSSHHSFSGDSCNPPLIGFHFVITLISKRDDLLTIEGVLKTNEILDKEKGMQRSEKALARLQLMLLLS
jgi:hypothetical protein